MRIVVFKNKHKEKEKHPDYIIYRSEEGQDLEKVGALWAKKGKSGKGYMSGDIDMPSVSSEYPKDTITNFNDDDIPF